MLLLAHQPSLWSELVSISAEDLFICMSNPAVNPYNGPSREESGRNSGTAFRDLPLGACASPP